MRTKSIYIKVDVHNARNMIPVYIRKKCEAIKHLFDTVVQYSTSYIQINIGRSVTGI